LSPSKILAGVSASKSYTADSTKKNTFSASLIQLEKSPERAAPNPIITPSRIFTTASVLID